MRSKKIFFRTLKISFVIFFNIFLLILGICEAYKNTRLLSFGEYTRIIEINEDYIKIFDKNIKLPDYIK